LLQRNCRAAFQWRKGKPGTLATSRSHKDASSPPYPVPSNPGPPSRKVAERSVGLTRRRPIGRRKLSAPATDANRSAVRPTSVSALIAPPSTNSYLTGTAANRKGGSPPVARCGLAWRKARLGAQGRAGENDSLFEHPEVILSLEPYGKFQLYCRHQPSFSAAR